MSTTMHHGWITEHRGWEDYLSAFLGLLIVLSPTLAGGEVSAAVMLSSGFVGVLITALAMLELVSLERWEEVLELACGVWIAAAPLLLGYGGALAAIHHVLGAAVALLAIVELWQDRNRSLTG